MPERLSTYEATNRWRITAASRERAKRLYNHNYSEFLPHDRGARILDLGCSEGIAIEWLLENGYGDVFGVDSDEVAIQEAREMLENQTITAQVDCADMREYLKLQESSSVDTVIMLNVIEHLEKPYLMESLAEIRRLLKPGGAFLAQTGNMENPFNFGLFARDFTHQIPFTVNSLRQALIMSGFEVKSVNIRTVRFETTLRNFPLQIASPVAGWIVKQVAASMRMKIQETEPLIYCVARK